MKKLKQATINELKEFLPADDLKYFETNNQVFESYILNSVKPFEKRDDSLIELEIAFRKCKRVGVFS